MVHQHQSLGGVEWGNGRTEVLEERSLFPDCTVVTEAAHGAGSHGEGSSWYFGNIPALHFAKGPVTERVHVEHLDWEGNLAIGSLGQYINSVRYARGRVVVVVIHVDQYFASS